MFRRIAVCDDDKAVLRQLSEYLTQIQQETGDEYDVFYYTSGEELLRHMPRDVQVILLDIGMGSLSGMDAARCLREEGIHAALIFITSMTECALEGYGVHAFGFLGKPVVYAELRKHLTECFAQMDRMHQSVIAVETGGGTEILPLADILFAEVFQHETSFTSRGGKITGMIQLAQVEKQIAPHGFFRCHRCYLVNLERIRRIDTTALTMENGDMVPISRHRRKAFLDAYASYMGVRL